MLFSKLKIGVKYPEKQLTFYRDCLGFPIRESNHSVLTVDAGATLLIFSKQIDVPSLYHFAFLIPTGSLESAIDYVESRAIKLLKFKGEKIVHFDTGRSIYFFDMDGNIAEFIERPSLDYPSKQVFNIEDVICVNEIGHPVKDTLEVSQKLMNHHGINPINHKTWNEKFCWVGDHEGAIIVVKEGRHWMPTELPGVLNDFNLEYIEQGIKRTLIFKSGKIVT